MNNTINLSWLRKQNIFLIIYFIITITIQVTFACILVYEPEYDVKSVFDGAIALAETGKLSEELTMYFAWFSNNFGFAFIMSIIIKIAGIVSKNYFLIFAFTNIIFINIGVYFLYDLIRRMCGVKIACATLVMLFFYIPMYFFPSMIYTDAATMSIPIICLNLFVRIETETMSKKKSIIYYILISVVSGIGFAIKPTAAIMFIAIVICSCVFIRKALAYKSIALSIAIFIAIMILFKIPYNANVPEDIHDANAIPYTHWVMIGLLDPQIAAWDDYVTTLSFPTYAQKNANAIATIKTRLNDMGVNGFGKLIAQKFNALYSRSDFQPGGVIVFGSNEASKKLGDMRFNNVFYITYNSIFFYGTIILAFLSVFLYTRNVTAYLAIFGIHLFLLFWEVNPRYLTNYFFVFIFLACLSIKALVERKNVSHETKA